MDYPILIKQQQQENYTIFTAKCEMWDEELYKCTTIQIYRYRYIYSFSFSYSYSCSYGYRYRYFRLPKDTDVKRMTQTSLQWQHSQKCGKRGGKKVTEAQVN